MEGGPALLFYALALVLPLSALIARRLPARQLGVMALAWLGIFAVALLTLSVLEFT